jgi:hypothetical protein
MVSAVHFKQKFKYVQILQLIQDQLFENSLRGLRFMSWVTSDSHVEWLKLGKLYLYPQPSSPTMKRVQVKGRLFHLSVLTVDISLWVIIFELVFYFLVGWARLLANPHWTRIKGGELTPWEREWGFGCASAATMRVRTQQYRWNIRIPPKEHVCQIRNCCFFVVVVAIRM